MQADYSDYTMPYLYKCLENYGTIGEGRWFETDDDEKPIKAPGYRASFETAVVVKSDIDIAIRALPPDEKKAVLYTYILPEEQWTDKHYLETDRTWEVKRAVRHIRHYLSNCQLREWAKINGLYHDRYIDIPNTLPVEILDFTKEICTRYCSLERCVDD